MEPDGPCARVQHEGVQRSVPAVVGRRPPEEDKERYSLALASFSSGGATPSM